MAAIIRLYLVPRYEAMTTALWCPACLKPSGYELSFDRISESGVTPSVLTLRKCHDCEGPL